MCEHDSQHLSPRKKGGVGRVQEELGESEDKELKEMEEDKQGI